MRAFLHPLVCDKDKQGSGEGAQVSPVLSARSLPLSQQHTPLGSPGIYIRTLIEGSPAAADGRLAIGDRILAVNGTSLIGADYQSAVDLIRSGGKKLRFLVAKSDMEIAKKIISSSASS